MGVPTKDCKQVATLIGVKTFTNEFIAYDNLATLIKNRLTISTFDNATFMPINDCWDVGNSTFSACLPMISVSSPNEFMCRDNGIAQFSYGS